MNRRAAASIGGWLSVALALALAISVAPALGPGVAQAQGPNLLQNAGFEEDARMVTAVSLLANGWNSYWKARPEGDTSPTSFEPQYDVTKGAPRPPAHGGVAIQKFHNMWASHDAGIWQRVGGITPGTTVTFSCWMWGWSRNNDDWVSSGPDIEKNVGIDPTGTTPPPAAIVLPSNIVWSASDWTMDNWVLLSVTAAATGDGVVVFTRSRPKFPVKWNASFLDDCSLTASGTAAPTAVPTAAPQPTVVAPPAPAEPQDERYFSQTGFRIGDDRFWDYFNKRGGVRTFGYPTSRKFKLLGRDVQFFQRRVIQLQADGLVGQLNLLDEGVMPYNTINGATFPKHDANLTARIPPPTSPDYNSAVAEYLKAQAPDNWMSLDTNFYRTFSDTVTAADAFPQGGDAGLLPGFNLEMWGVPTSIPALDPTNYNFVYLRFQRGIMHFDKGTGVTQGLLIGDYFKALFTGQNLPQDLEQQARGSRFYRQYNPSFAGAVARPAELSDTDMLYAFEPGPRT